MMLECKRCKKRTTINIHPLHKLCDKCWKDTRKNPFTRGD